MLKTVSIVLVSILLNGAMLISPAYAQTPSPTPSNFDRTVDAFAEAMAITLIGLFAFALVVIAAICIFLWIQNRKDKRNRVNGA